MNDWTNNPWSYIVPNVIGFIVGIILFVYKARSPYYNSDDLVSAGMTTLLLLFFGWAALALGIIIGSVAAVVYCFTEFCKYLKK